MVIALLADLDFLAEPASYLAAAVPASLVIWHERIRIGRVLRRLTAQMRTESPERTRLPLSQGNGHFQEDQFALLGKWRRRFDRRSAATEAELLSRLGRD